MYEVACHAQLARVNVAIDAGDRYQQSERALCCPIGRAWQRQLFSRDVRNKQSGREAQAFARFAAVHLTDTVNAESAGCLALKAPGLQIG